MRHEVSGNTRIKIKAKKGRTLRMLAGLTAIFLIASLVAVVWNPGKARAAIALQGTNTFTSPTGTTVSSFSLTKPAATVSGSVLVVQLLFDPGTNKNVTVTKPTGWTQIGSNILNGNWWQAVFYKVAGGSEPSSYSFSISRASYVASGISAFSGVDNTTPIDDNATFSGGGTNSTTHSAPSVSPITNGDMLLGFWGFRTNITANGYDTGFTQAWTTSTTNVGIASAYKLLTNAGATGTFNSTTASNTTWLADSIALLPAQRPPGISFVNSTTNSCASCTSLSTSSPTNWASGDFFIVSLTWSTSVTLTKPDSTWIQLGTTLTSGTFSMADFYHVAASGDPSSYTWSFSGSTDVIGGEADYGGVDTSAPIDDDQTAVDASSVSAHVAPAVTSTHSNDYYVGTWGYAAAMHSGSYTSTLTQSWDVLGNSTGGSSAYQALGNAGTSSTFTANSVNNRNQSRTGIAMMRSLALKPFIPLPRLYAPGSNATDVVLEPTFQLNDKLLATGTEEYEIQLCSDSACNTVINTYDETSSQTGWSGQDAGGGTAYNGTTSYGTSTIASFTPSSPLSTGTQYWWRGLSYNVSGGYWTPPSNISTFTTSYVPAAPTFFAPASGTTGLSITPEFHLASTDQDADNLQYKLQICADSACSTVLYTYDETSSQSGWSGQDSDNYTDYASDTSSAVNSTLAYLTPTTPLNPNTQYWYRAYAIDPSGTNTWSAASTIRTFTTAAAETRILQGNLLRAKIL